MKSTDRNGSRTLISITFVTLILLQVGVSKSQDRDGDSRIQLKSWRTGNAVCENLYNFTLDQSGANRVEYITSSGYGTYKLSFRFGKADPRESWDRDKWQVVLQEVLSTSGYKKEKLGCNLLLVSGCGPGGHHFPKEDNAGVLFPTTEPTNPVEKIMLARYYPIAVKRTFWVRTFLVTLDVTDFKVNATDRQKLDSMKVSIGFKNILTEYK